MPTVNAVQFFGDNVPHTVAVCSSWLVHIPISFNYKRASCDLYVPRIVFTC